MKKLIPKYARIPLLTALTINCFVYFVLRLFLRDAVHYDLSLPLDSAIPFVPSFILIYILAYPQWVLGYILICRDSEELCYRVMAGEIISKLICGLFFIFLPTTMSRPEVVGDGIFEKLTRLIYSLDAPDNLFPSVHCAESWLCFRCALEAKSLPRAYKWGSLVFTLLVFASTVLVKQHVLVDIPAALIVAELGQLLSRRTRAGRCFEKLNNGIFGETL